RIESNNDGTCEHASLANRYGSMSIDSPAERVMMLEAGGHSSEYVNGEPRTGDPYENGLVSIPVFLRSGRNDLLCLCARGKLSIRLNETRRSGSFIDNPAIAGASTFV